MANKIQFKRGIKANLPILNVGEPAFTTDTNEFYIGNGSSNIEFSKQSDLNLLNTNVSNINMGLTNYISYGAKFAKTNSLKGDGITNDYTALNTLITSIGSNPTEIYFSSGTYIIGGSLTIPANIKLIFAKGAILSPSNGVTITINGCIEAGLYQIFTGSGTIAGTPNVSFIYPEWFGAVVGSDSTSAINKSIVFAGQAGGGLVVLQDGTYITSSVINIKYNNVVLIGSGNGTIISCNFATGNIFYAGRSSTSETAVENVEFRNMKIISTVTRTSGAVFYCQYAERFTFDNIWIAETGSNMYNGIFLDKFDNVLLSRILVYNCTNTGIRLNGLSDQSWGANVFLNNGSKIFNCNYGVHIAGAVGGLTIEDCDVIGNTMNIILDTTVANVKNREIFINQCFIDSAGNMGLQIGDNGVAYLQITGTWIASSGLISNGGGVDGNGINTTSNQYSDMNVVMSGCRIYNCFGSGMVINAGRWTINGCNIHTNGRGTLGGYGIYTPNIFPKILITGCQITDNGNPALGVGVQTIDGLNGFIISNNIIVNNKTAQIVDNSSTTNKIIENNLIS